jgi:hypothetical protein
VAPSSPSPSVAWPSALSPPQETTLIPHGIRQAQMATANHYRS